MAKRRVTFRMEEGLVKQIEELVSQGQIDSLTDFIVKCIERGLKYSIHKWDNGVWYAHGIRVGGLSKENIDSISTDLEDPFLYEMGRRLGKQYSMSINYMLQIETKNRKNWARALKETELMSGWGNYLLKDNYITVVSPLLPGEAIRGFLESFLGIKIKQVSEEPLRYEVQEK